MPNFNQIKKKSQKVFLCNIQVCAKKHQTNPGKSHLFPIVLEGISLCFSVSLWINFRSHRKKGFCWSLKVNTAILQCLVTDVLGILNSLSIWQGLSAFLWGHLVRILLKTFHFNTCMHVICLLPGCFYKFELENFQHKHCIVSKCWHVHSSRNQSHICKYFFLFNKAYNYYSSSIHFHMQHSVICSFFFYTLYNTNTWGDSQQQNLLQQPLQLKLHFIHPHPG